MKILGRGRSRAVGLVATCALWFGVVAAWAQSGPDAVQQYQATMDAADKLLAAGDAFEAVRRYEQAGRIAYNNKLSTDKDELAAKLAAARAARDDKSAAKQAAPASASTPAAPAPAPATATLPTADDPEAWVRYADALVAATDYFDAVRAYERARRMASDRHVAIDTASVDAKRAEAIRLRDAPKAGSGDLVAEPPPPLPPEPGSRETHWLVDRPGRIAPWQLHAEGFVVAATRATPADLQAFDANLHKVMGVLAKAPVLDPPVGFDFDVHAALGGNTFDQPELRGIGAARLPLQTEIRFSGSSFYAHGSAVGKSEEAACRTGLNINTLPSFSTPFFKPDAKSDETYFVEPARDGDLGGVAVFGDTLVIARPDVPLWLPVSYQQALAALLPKYQASADYARRGIAERQKKYQAYMGTEAQEKRRREVATERDAGREEYARKLELMQRRWEQDAQKESDTAASDPKLREPIDLYERVQAFAAGLDAAGRSAQACIVAKSRSAESAWELVPTGTPGCAPLVRTNPHLLDARRPRTALQVIYLARVGLPNEWFAGDRGRALRSKPGDCVALAKILRQTDWSALRALLEQ